MSLRRRQGTWNYVNTEYVCRYVLPTRQLTCDTAVLTSTSTFSGAKTRAWNQFWVSSQVRLGCGVLLVRLTVSMAGYSLDQRTVPEDQLGAYVQEAIDMVSRRATYSRSRLHK